MKKIINIFLILFGLSANSLAAQENTIPAFHEEPGDRQVMAMVILENLTVWVRPADQEPVYRSFCRNLEHGCEAQIQVYVDYIYDAAEEHNMDPWILAAVAWHESRFNAFAENDFGAVGMFQLLKHGRWSTGLPFVRQRAYRERCRNVLGACQRPSVIRATYWLRRSAEHCGDIRLGLRLYNSGRCDGPRRYSRAIFSTRERLYNRAMEIKTLLQEEYSNDNNIVASEQ